MSIVVQPVSVSYYQSPDRIESGLVYQPYQIMWSNSLGGKPPRDFNIQSGGLDDNFPDPRFRTIDNWNRLGQKINDIYATAKLLIAGQEIKNSFVTKITEFSYEILPTCGLQGIFAPHTCSQLITINDFAARIPWEAVLDFYKVCPKGHMALRMSPEYSPLAHVQTCFDNNQTFGTSLNGQVRYCQMCTAELQDVVIRLSMDYQVCHLVHGQKPAIPKGNEFVLIEDPLSDLCAPRNDPDGTCREHLIRIRSMLENKGYTVTWLAGSMANAQNIIQHLRDPNVAGLYYFGHGLYDSETRQGGLHLADGIINASEITRAAPAIPFIFLNGCYCATTGTNWEVERKPSSIAEAFARKARMVIAPVFGILNIDAAHFALHFFQNALGGQLVGEAVFHARQVSLDRFENTSRPDICWMAHRMLGNPNCSVMPSVYDTPFQNQEVHVAPICRTFGKDDELKMEFFAFSADEVFVRAGRRRALQKRALVTVLDLIAGLVRKGELTRTLLRQCEVDPDKIYETILTTRQTDPPGVTRPQTETPEDSDDNKNKNILDLFWGQHKEDLRKLVEQSMIHGKGECTNELVEVLIHADAFAQRDQGGSSELITERHVLETLFDSGKWPAGQIENLPSAVQLKEKIQDILQAGQIDGNGIIYLDKLDPGAQKVIETAHALSEKLGHFPISNRMLMASFLASEESYVYHLFEDYAQDPDMHFARLYGSIERKQSHTFHLGMEACQRAVLPVLAYCWNELKEGEKIDERMLFRGFCAVSPTPLKQGLQRVPFPLDLEYLAQLDPLPNFFKKENYEDAAWRLMCRAFALSETENLPRIRTGHLLAAILIEARNRMDDYLKSTSVGISDVYKTMISSKLQPDISLLSKIEKRPSFNARVILIRAERIARHICGTSLVSA